MKKLFGFLISLVLLNGCSIPLVSSFTSGGITGAVTGKYHQSAANTAFDFIIHEHTGKTPAQIVWERMQKSKKPDPLS